MSLKIEKGSIDGLIHVQPQVYGDERGYFVESYNRQSLFELGFAPNFVQDNESKSKKGVIRGLHYQTSQQQGKLVRCVSGKILDVAVDIRKDSPTFGRWESVVLDSEKKNMFYIPKGFAHGFLVLSDEAIFSYKCTDYYAPQYDAGVLWNDPTINIDWKLNEYGILKPILSKKDLNQPLLSDCKFSLKK